MNEDVVFWTWISDSTLGLVTEKEVLHWKVMEGQAAPTKVSTGICKAKALHPFLSAFASDKSLTDLSRCLTDMLPLPTTKSSHTALPPTSLGCV